MRAPRILVATDFSEHALEAARVAARLAVRPQDVVVAHALPLLSVPAMVGSPGMGGVALPAVPMGAPPEDLEESVRASLRDWVGEAGLAGARVEVLPGAPGAAIARLAREVEADLVVAGATGRSGFERVLLGTTATTVLHEVAADVLLVRGRAPPPGGPTFPRVLVGADLSDGALGRRVEPHARALRRDGSEIVLAHVRDRTLRGWAMEPAEAERRLRAFNERFLEGRAREVLAEGRPADELRRLAAQERASLLVLGSTGAGAVERFLLGSVTTSLAEKAPCSVLVLKPRA